MQVLCMTHLLFAQVNSDWKKHRHQNAHSQHWADDNLFVINNIISENFSWGKYNKEGTFRWSNTIATTSTEPEPTLVVRQPLNGHLIRDIIDGWLASVITLKPCECFSLVNQTPPFRRPFYAIA